MGSNARLMGGSSARKDGASGEYYGDQGLRELREACGMGVAKPGKVPCLKCQEDFNSPDKIRIRICFVCKRTVEWQTSRETDVLFPAIPKNMGYNDAREVASKARARKGSLVSKKKSPLGVKSAAKKRSLSRNQKHFGKKPLSKKRTRT